MNPGLLGVVDPPEIGRGNRGPNKLKRSAAPAIRQLSPGTSRAARNSLPGSVLRQAGNIPKNPPRRGLTGSEARAYRREHVGRTDAHMVTPSAVVAIADSRSCGECFRDRRLGAAMRRRGCHLRRDFHWELPALDRPPKSDGHP